jgi:hypothetical protein
LPPKFTTEAKGGGTDRGHQGLNVDTGRWSRHRDSGDGGVVNDHGGSHARDAKGRFFPVEGDAGATDFGQLSLEEAFGGDGVRGSPDELVGI